MAESRSQAPDASWRRVWLRVLAILGLLGLLAASGWIAYACWLQATAAETVDREMREASRRPEAYSPGAVFIEGDSYYWLGYVRDQREAGGWRAPRWTHRDNAPEGRAVHWTSPFFWVMRGAGEVVARARDLPFTAALEVGAVRVGPLLHLVTVILGAVLLARRFGWFAAGAFALAMVAQHESHWAFHALRPDHQALYGLTSVLALILLIGGGLGHVRPDEAPREIVRRRLWFAAAGLVGAVGIWVSATVSVAQNLLVMAAVAGVALWRQRRESGEGETDPDAWRWWGWSGALACLAAWLIEYAPALPWGRLEVIHPLYALQWLAAGEALRLWTGWRQLRAPWSRRRVTGLAIAGTGVLAAPLLLAFGPQELHALRDPFMRGIHRHIIEFQSFRALEGPHALKAFLNSYQAMLAPLIVVPAMLLVREIPVRTRQILLTVWVATVAMLVLGLLQVRWMALYAGFQAVLLGITLGTLGRFTGRGLIPARALALLLVLGLGVHATRFFRHHHLATHALIHSESLTPAVLSRTHNQEIVNSALLKHMALDLGRRRGGAPWRAMANTDLAPFLHYFAGIPAVGSLYWENAAGLRDTLAFLNDESGATAQDIARTRGITHTILIASHDSARYFHDLAGLPHIDGRPRPSLVSRLVVDSPDLPLWLFPEVTLTAAAITPRRFRNRTFEAPIIVHRVQASGR